MLKNVAGQKVKFSLFKSGARVAAPTIAVGDFKVDIDGAGQANVTTPPTSDAAGLVTWLPSQAETNGKYVTLLANDAAGSEWEPLTIVNETEMPTSVEAILVDTAVIGAAGAGLTALGDTRLANLDATVSSRGTADPGDAMTLAAGAITATVIAAGAIDADALATDAVAEIVDAVFDETSTGHTDAGKAGAQIWTDVDAILADTGTDGVVLAADSIKKVTFDETTAWPLLAADSGSTYIARTGADSDTLETLSDQLDDTPTLGAGAIEWTYTLTSSVDGTAIGQADVWVTTDSAGTNVVASGTTSDLGVVTFYLDAGSTYYIWRSKSGWTFTNPDSETVS